MSLLRPLLVCWKKYKLTMAIAHSKYWKKILLLNLFVGAFPVVIIGSFSYLKVGEIIQDNVREANSTMLLLTQNNVEKELKIIDHSIIRVMDSPLIYSAMSKTVSSADFQRINEISYALRNIRSFHLMPENVFFINFEYKWLIDTDGVSFFDDSGIDESIVSYLDVNKSSFWKMHSDNLADSSYTQRVDLVKKVPLNSIDSSELVVIRMPLHQISRQVPSEKYLGEMMILDDEFHVISHAREDNLGKNYSDLAKRINQNNSMSGELELEVNGASHLVVYRRSEYNNWLYVLSTPISTILMETKSIGNLTLAICVVILLFLVFISLAGSSTLYRPVKELYDAIKTQGKDKIDAVDEFDVINNKLAQLSKSYDQMLASSVREKEQLQELYIIKLLHGQIRNNKHEAFPVVLDYLQKWRKENILIIGIPTLVDTPFNNKEIDLVLVALSSHIKEEIPELMRLGPVIIDSNIVLLLGRELVDRDMSSNLPSDLASALKQSVYKKYSVNIHIAVGRTLDGLEGAFASFRETSEMLKRAMLKGNSITSMDDNCGKNFAKHVMADQLKSDLVDALINIDRFRVHELINEMQELYYREKNSIHEFKEYFLKIILDISALVHAKNGYICLFDGGIDCVLKELIDMKEYSLISMYVHDKILVPIMNALEQYTKDDRFHLVEETIKIIEKEYDSDITLDSSAMRLHCSPDHLGRVFKKETGFNYGDYLIWYRIKIAKKLLTDTDMKIFEISEKLRYSNPQNFIRTFRRIEGRTPGQYRMVASSHYHR